VELRFILPRPQKLGFIYDKCIKTETSAGCHRRPFFFFLQVSAMDEVAQFHYIQWEERFASQEKPYYCMMDVPADFPKANFKTDKGPVQAVEDMRHDLSRFSLDSNAFVIREHAMPITSFDNSTVEATYLPSLEALIKQEFGKDVEVMFFDWRVSL
jgi:hypothetical protein